MIGRKLLSLTDFILEITEENENYIIDAEYLDSVSAAFANWKKGI